VSRPAVVPAASAAPTAEDLRDLTALWRSLLGVEVVAPQDDFFISGGDEARLGDLVELIDEAYDVRLRPDQLREASTLLAMAALIKATARRDFGRVSAPVMLASGQDERAAVVFVAALGAGVIGWRRVAAHLDARLPAFAHEATGFAPSGAPMHRVEDIARYRITQLREVLADRPLVLVGHSFGGTVAYEMARQLVANGHDVAGLVLLDTSAAKRTAQEPFHLARARAIARRRLRLEKKVARARLAVRLRARRDLRTLSDESRVRWVIDSQRAANREYRRRGYPGDVTLFKVRSSRRRSDPSLGWRRFVTKTIHVEELPGHHTALLNPDWAATTAAALDGCLLRLTER
jgi:thioesterase domain-containing protein